MSQHFQRDNYQTITGVDKVHCQNFLECEESPEYLLFSSEKRSIDEVMTMQQEPNSEPNFDENLVTESKFLQTNTTETPVYFEESLGTCEEVTVDYDENITAEVLPPVCPQSPRLEFKLEKDWPDDQASMPMHIDYEDNSDCKEHFANEYGDDYMDSADEETIATFVTAAGQQLALYSVEDSEDVFAVALYNESGNPPSDFQFLMKSDVERLIGEGAVKTVKKPIQMRKQLLTTQPPLLSCSNNESSNILNNLENDSYDKFEYKNCLEDSWRANTIINANCRTVLHSNDKLCDNYDSSKHLSDVTYLMTDDDSTGIVLTGQTDCNPKIETNDHEFVEQSTVQYILLDSDQSESELTFDEIQATLRGLKCSARKTPQKMIQSNKSSTDQQLEIPQNVNGIMVVKAVTECTDSRNQSTLDSSVDDTLNEVPEISDVINGNHTELTEECLINSMSNSLQFRSFKKRSSVIKASRSVKDDTIKCDSRSKSNFMDGIGSSIDIDPLDTSSARSTMKSKIKRPRKQQLTSVNRGDCEIIIQSSLLGTDEENNNKRRNRRKKKHVSDPDYNPKLVRGHKIKRVRKPSKIEVIEIDIDEEQCLAKIRDDVIEITIEENREKESSDKENEIIMVGDSDDETDIATKPPSDILQCKHCFRNYRQRKAFNNHSKDCPKLQSTTKKNDKKTFQGNRRLSGRVKQKDEEHRDKKFTCKVCHENFDAVMALARHARIHQRKHKTKARRTGQKYKPVRGSKDVAVESPAKDPVTPSKRPKKIQSPGQTWKSKRLSCNVCGRWFPSMALLAAHALQHATKKSENQVRQCSICKHRITTQVLYINHMKTHCRPSSNEQAQINFRQTRSRRSKRASNTVPNVKKRGRP